MRLKKRTIVRAKQCSTCPFLPKQRVITPGALSDIKEYLLAGTQHLCNQDHRNATICRGARDWQLQIWHRMGILTAPTDAALKEAVLRYTQ